MSKNSHTNPDLLKLCHNDMHSQAGCGSFKLRQVILPNPRSQRQSLLRSTAVPKQSHALQPWLWKSCPAATCPGPGLSQGQTMSPLPVSAALHNWTDRAASQEGGSEKPMQPGTIVKSLGGLQVGVWARGSSKVPWKLPSAPSFHNWLTKEKACPLEIVCSEWRLRSVSVHDRKHERLQCDLTLSWAFYHIYNSICPINTRKTFKMHPELLLE